MDIIIISAIVLIISLLIHVVAYFIGKMTSNEILITGARDEFIEVLSSGILIVFLLFLISKNPQGISAADGISGIVISSIIPSLNYNTSLSVRDNYHIISNRLSNVMNDELNLVISAYKNSTIIAQSDISQRLNGLPLSNGELQLSYSYMPCTAYSYISTIISPLISTILNGINIMRMFDTLVELADYRFFVAFAMFGLLLRSVPITRWAGNFLISMAIGLYLFVPLSFIFVDGMVLDYYSSIPTLSNFINPITPHVSETPSTDEIIDVCVLHSPLNVVENAIDIYGSNSNKDPSKFVLFIYLVMIARGFAILIMISTIAGFMSIFGTRISPYVLSILLRV